MKKILFISLITCLSTNIAAHADTTPTAPSVPSVEETLLLGTMSTITSIIPSAIDSLENDNLVKACLGVGAIYDAEQTASTIYSNYQDQLSPKAQANYQSFTSKINDIGDLSEGCTGESAANSRTKILLALALTKIQDSLNATFAQE